MVVSFKFLCITLLLSATLSFAKDHVAGEVTYDGRSLLINGKREILISGSIHYPRSVPEMWPDLIAKAKAGGINVIQTYVFWNGHEAVKGQYHFEGRFDLVKFIKEIQRQGLYCTLRIGPFIQAEWHHGGFPYWLRDEPGIVFRTDNGPFKYYMRKFVKYIIDMMKREKLFAPEGGPIILAQIENEYDLVKKAFRQGGDRYLQWAGNLAINSKAGVPWMMCKQTGAPGPIISSCNGRNCGDTFSGPHPEKPLIWAEDWTAQFRAFGDPPSQRSTEDLAYGVARFFSKNGTLINYYMYHGGTNFGRTAAPFVTTRYYDEAPLDEFGLIKEPKYGHLSDLHYVLRLSQKPLLYGDYSIERLGKGLEARVYQGHGGKKSCVAFLSNDNTRLDQTITFRGEQYFLPRHSISILVDCKTVAFNTQRVSAQHNARTFVNYKAANKDNEWQMYKEHIPKYSDKDNIYAPQPMELFNLTKDETDYVWYSTNFNLDDRDMPRRSNIRPVVQISSLGHAMIGFANDEYIGDGHGNRIEKSFVYSKPMRLKPGENHLSFLGMSVGHPDGGAYLEHRLAGIHTVAVQGLNTGTFDLTLSKWGHKVGLDGEKKQIYTEEGQSKVKWTKAKKGMPVTWYKRYFDAPKEDEYVAVNMSSMAKGMVWINGENIGRFWVSYLNPLGEPSQDMYHIPRSLLKRKDNLIVVFEESGGDPEGITFSTVHRDNICSVVSTLHPADVKLWKREGGDLKNKRGKPEASLECYDRKVIKEVVFADFGNPGGNCGDYASGNCTSPTAKKAVEKECLGKNSCMLDVDASSYGADPNCPGTLNTLAVHVKCSRPSKDD